jgi:Domain of unknown function (DUF4157)
MFDHGRVKAPRLQAPGRETSRTSVPPAVHAGAAPSRDEMPPGSPAPFDFSRISIVPVDDPGERAAEQTADQVLHMRSSSAAPPAGSGRGVAAGVPVPGPGEPMDAVARAFMEPRFGFDFRDVRVRSGGEAAASARVLGARAYAIGRHVVFGEGEYSPSTASGRRLLAHELAHVVQDDTSHVVRRQPKPPRKWAQIWSEFASARADKPALATVLANELASTPSEGDDLLEHGMEVVDWLHTHGSAPAALRLLADVRKRFKVGTTAGGKPLRFWDLQSLRPSQAPEILIARGKAAARAGQHDQAFEFFGVANEILWLYIQQVSQTKPFGGPELISYPQHRVLYGRLREIYGFYSVLEQEARAAGDMTRVLNAKFHGAALRTVLQKEFTPAGEVELAELTAVETPQGEALRLIGANTEVTDLTQLPGLESPKELVNKSGGATQVEEISALQTALVSQEALQTEIGRVPEIQKAFPKGPIDLNDTKTRQTVWRLMYGVYKRASANPLESLMTLVSKYLKAYTHHTTYNIRDFGKNYLDTNFPVNLAGQIERDCGVYALRGVGRLRDGEARGSGCGGYLLAASHAGPHHPGDGRQVHGPVLRREQ